MGGVLRAVAVPLRVVGPYTGHYRLLAARGPLRASTDGFSDTGHHGMVIGGKGTYGLMEAAPEVFCPTHLSGTGLDKGITSRVITQGRMIRYHGSTCGDGGGRQVRLGGITYVDTGDTSAAWIKCLGDGSYVDGCGLDRSGHVARLANQHQE